MRPLTKWLRRLIGLFVLLPVAVVGLMALVQQLSAREIDVSFFSSVAVWYSLMGILLWCVIGFSHVCDLACIYLYVLGHELTHAAAVLCSFGKVESFSVTVEGGYVETTKNNLFIALSPYFIPLWALLWMGLMSLLHMFWTFAGYEELFYLGAGFLWGSICTGRPGLFPASSPIWTRTGRFFVYAGICRQFVDDRADSPLFRAGVSERFGRRFHGSPACGGRDAGRCGRMAAVAVLSGAGCCRFVAGSAG